MRAWESDFREFVAASAGALRRQAYARCGDWDIAERIVAATLTRLYRRWPALGLEPPEDFAQRTLLFKLRRHHRAEAPQELEPPMGIFADDLITEGKRGRRRDRLVASAMSVAVAASIGVIFIAFAPGLGGGPAPEPADCMAGVPGATPLPAVTLGVSVPADSGVRGLDRLAVMDLPLPQADPPPPPASAGALACILADQFVHWVNPPNLVRVDLGLNDGGERRSLVPLPDPEIAPGALTASVQVVTQVDYGTITISVAPTTRLPDRAHCDRIPYCKLSSTGHRGEVMEQYGLRDGRDAWDLGFTMGNNAEIWTAVVYTGHTMIVVSITNTPDVRAALPATRNRAPLGAQITILALDPRLAIYDPPASLPTSDATEEPQ